MPNQKDVRISRRLETIMRKVVALVEKECEGESMNVALFLHPVAKSESDSEIREFQYISNMDRMHMLQMLKATVGKWEAGQPDVPPHERQ